MNLVIRRTAGLGDVVAATVVAEALYRAGHVVTWKCGPLLHPIVRCCPFIRKVEDPLGSVHVDLDGCYEHSTVRGFANFHNLFLAAALRQVGDLSIDMDQSKWESLRPKLIVRSNDHQAMLGKLSRYPTPWIGFATQSNYITRHIPNGIAYDTAKLLPGTKFWLSRDPAPPGIIDLKVNDLSMLLTTISVLDLLICCDSGPMHLAAAVNTPIVAVSQAFDVALRLPPGAKSEIVHPNLTCLNCQKHKCPVNEYAPPCHRIDPLEIVVVADRVLLDTATA